MFRSSFYYLFLRYFQVFKHLALVNLLLLTPAMLSAQTMEPLAVAKKLQNTYEKATNLVADFNQKTAMKFSSRERQGSGTLIFSKPGKMRWDYKAPDFQVFISDGETFTLYFEKSNQMIITNAKEYLQSDVTYSFFAGTGNILKDFDVREPDFINNTENSYLIKLTPKSSHPHVTSIHAWITRDSFLITRLQVIDHFDTVTDLFFGNIQIDAENYGSLKIEDELFFFLPPANTEIIEQY